MRDKTSKSAVSDTLDKAKETASGLAGKVSEAADQAQATASDIAKSATEQAKTFASELERMARNNPIGTIAGAVLVGVVIGILGRGRS